MPNGLGIAVMLPASAVGPISCVGTMPGASVLQVLNLVTGADVTSSFDAALTFQDSIFQLDTVPSHTTNHLVAFQLPDADVVTTKFAVVNSLGSSPTTHGSVVAPGVSAGDVIVQAVQPLTVFAFGSSADVTFYFAPTSPSSATVTQIQGLSTGDSILLLLRASGTPLPNMRLSISDGGGGGGGLGYLGIQSVKIGDRLVSALDLTNVADVTAAFQPIISHDSWVGTIPGSSINGVMLFLFETA